MVPEHLRAWHAGVGHWAGESDINGCSIGIEIANGGHDFGSPPYPDIQMRAVEALCRDILSRHPIPPRRVLGHSDIAPGRKADPGEWFDWARLSRAGIGLWVKPEPVIEGPSLNKGDRGDTVAELQFMLGDYGYGIEVLGRYDEALPHMERAVELMPSDPILNDHLGDVYWVLGRYREARFQWRRALSFGPHDDLDMERVRQKLDVGLYQVLEDEGETLPHQDL